MTPVDAAKLLEIAPDTSSEQIETRFLELRRKLEDKIAKAPTPGLQAKYRESLAEITTAFEVLTLAADSSTLPVLNKQSAAGDPRLAGGPASLRTGARANPPSEVRPSPSRKSNKEFLIVAVIAVAVLGAGGWWVMKTRAEREEKTRLEQQAKLESEQKATAAKAEQERKAEEARIAVEAKRQAEEEEKARIAAAAKAEQDRLEKLTGQLRSELAAGKVGWEAIEREERAAERRLSDLKSDLRSLRDPAVGKLAEARAVVAAQQDYYDWLSGTIARHPARVARSRAEELIAARQPEAAQAAMEEFVAALGRLEAELPRQREAMLDLDGALAISTNPDVNWTLTDAFGRVRTGRGPAKLEGVSVGQAELRLTRDKWPERTEAIDVRRTAPASAESFFTGTDLLLDTAPSGARVIDAEGKEAGVTPFWLKEAAPGRYRFRFKLAGYYDETATFAVSGSGQEAGKIALRARPTALTKPKWRVPGRFSYESVYNSNTDGNRSTGTFAKSASAYNNQLSFSSHEEFAFSAPDDTGAWTRMERRVVRSQNAQVPAGLTLRYERQPDGKWTGSFVTGDVAEPNLRNAYLTFALPDGTWGNGWVDGAWPPEGTPVGGTWKVDPSVSVSAIGQPGYKNDVTGRVLAFDHEANADWVTLQFTATFSEKKDAVLSASGTCTVRVNLGEGYIAAVEGNNTMSMTVKAALIGQIGTDTRSNFNYKMTVR